MTKILQTFIAVGLSMLLCPGTSAVPEGQSDREDIVVMVHGAGGGGWEYDRWKPIFTQAGWRVIAPDLMPVKAGLGATTYADYLRQVKRWIPNHHRHLVLVGASMGGVLTLDAAKSLHPDAIVLVNSVPPAGVGKREPAKSYPAVIRWANGPIKETRDALPDGDEKTVQWAFTRWRDEAGRVLKTVQAGVKTAKPTCPTLVILGGKDTDVPLASGLALAAWTKSDIHLYAGTSHVGPLYGRRAEEIALAARRWIEARLGR